MLRLVVVFLVSIIFYLGSAEELTVLPTDDMYTDCLASGTHIAADLFLNKETTAADERIMFKFDVSSVVTLQSATFYLHRYFACGEGGGQTSANIYPITEAWDEATWDCHTFPQYDDGFAIPYIFTGPIAAQDTWYEIDLTTMVENWVYGLLPNYGFVIIADLGQNHSKFNSKESTTADFAPYLTINGTLPLTEVEVLPGFSAMNYPNPFNPETMISFNIPNETGTLTIYNTCGQKITRQNFTGGEHTYTWQADKYSSGTYFYQIKSGSNIITRKMSLIK